MTLKPSYSQAPPPPASPSRAANHQRFQTQDSLSSTDQLCGGVTQGNKALYNTDIATMHGRIQPFSINREPN